MTNGEGVDFVAFTRAAGKPVARVSRGRARSGDAAKQFMSDVRRACIAKLREIDPKHSWPFFPDRTPLAWRVEVSVERPPSHFKKSGALKATAPAMPTAKPDATNILKAAEDALGDWPRGAKPLLYKGDEANVDVSCSKRYGSPERVIVIVEESESLGETRR